MGDFHSAGIQVKTPYILIASSKVYSVCKPTMYNWIDDQQHAHQKLICQRDRRASTIPRPVLENSRGRESRSIPTIFCAHFGLLFIF